MDVFDLNFTQNLDIARRCIKYKKRLIQYSSAEVYGKASAGTAFSENQTDAVFGPVQKQRWIYATAKMLLERVLYAHGVAGDLEYTIVRPFNSSEAVSITLCPRTPSGAPACFPTSCLPSSQEDRSASWTADPFSEPSSILRTRIDAIPEDILDHPVEARNEVYNVGNPANDVTVRDVALLMTALYEELVGVAPHPSLSISRGRNFTARVRGWNPSSARCQQERSLRLGNPGTTFEPRCETPCHTISTRGAAEKCPAGVNASQALQPRLWSRVDLRRGRPRPSTAHRPRQREVVPGSFRAPRRQRGCRAAEKWRLIRVRHCTRPQMWRCAVSHGVHAAGCQPCISWSACRCWSQPSSGCQGV